MTNATATSLRPWWEGNRARLLDWAAVLTVVVLCVYVGRQEDLSWLGLVVPAIAVSVLTVIRWPYGAIFVLLAASVLPRFSVQLFGWNARPEHFAAAIVFLAAFVWGLRHSREMSWEKFDYFILAYVLMNYVSSAVASPSPSQTLRWALLNNLGVLPYFLIRFLVRDLDALQKALRILLVVGVLESIYGIFCLTSHYFLGTSVGMELGQYFGDVAAPYGTLYEPNFFGDYAACCAALFLALYLVEDRRLRYLMGFLVTSLATLLSFSRAALLALIVAVIWVFWRAGKPAKARYNRLAISTVVLGLILLVSLTAVGGVTKERFTNLFQQGLAEQTTITRLVVTEAALQDVPSHPILGNGTASFNLTFDWAKYIPEWGGGETWIGNAPLRILHDTGILGLAMIAIFAVMVWRRIRRGLREGQHPALLLALGAGILVYLVAFQSSDATTLAFSWVQIGFLASAAALISKQSGAAQSAGSLQSEQP